MTESPPTVLQYRDDYAEREFKGYRWFQLADVPSLAVLIHGGSEQRALVCMRCGSFVAFPEIHDANAHPIGGTG